MTANGHSTARPGFLFLICPDAQLLRERFGQAEKDNPPQDGGSWDRSCYWGDTDPPQDFWSNLSETSLFGTSHFIVVRQANLWAPSLWRRLDKILSRPGSAAACLSSASKMPGTGAAPSCPCFFPNCPVSTSPAKRAGSGAARASRTGISANSSRRRPRPAASVSRRRFCSILRKRCPVRPKSCVMNSIRSCSCTRRTAK